MKRDASPCPYRETIFCTSYQRTRCSNCGWNPEEEQRRLAKIQQQEEENRNE